MIYVTGDTHGFLMRFTDKSMKKKGFQLTEEDYLIVCGDFGLCWAKNDEYEKNCHELSNVRYTILWVQGNHENYDMIAEYPLEEWHGGKVRQIIRDKVILLERGQVFEIEGRKFFTFGGAASHDVNGGILDRTDLDFQDDRRKAIESGLPFRVNHESWWKEELPSEEEMEEGLKNLALCGYQVDYVITHCCATEIQHIIDRSPGQLYKSDRLTDYFQNLEEKLQYQHWYFGHYHMDMEVDDKHSLMYYDVICLGELPKFSERPSPGNPRYRLGMRVAFNWNGVAKAGKVCVVDAQGTFMQPDEPSYDILVEEENMIYKHMKESEIIRVVLP